MYTSGSVGAFSGHVVVVIPPWSRLLVDTNFRDCFLYCYKDEGTKEGDLAVYSLRRGGQRELRVRLKLLVKGKLESRIFYLSLLEYVSW